MGFNPFNRAMQETQQAVRQPAVRQQARPRLSRRLAVRRQYHLDEEPLQVTDPESAFQRRVVEAINRNPKLQGKPFIQMPNPEDPDGFDLIFNPTEEDKADWIGVNYLNMAPGMGRQFLAERDLPPEEEAFEKARQELMMDAFKQDDTLRSELGLDPYMSSAEEEAFEQAQIQAALDASLQLMESDFADLAAEAPEDPAARLRLRQELVRRIPSLAIYPQALSALGL